MTVVLAAGVGTMAGPMTATADASGPTSGGGSAPALCAPTAVHIVARTNRESYSAGQEVVLRSSITNVSSTSCSVWLGIDPGFSPDFVVINTKGNEVWDRCDVDDQPGACFTILV